MQYPKFKAASIFKRCSLKFMTMAKPFLPSSKGRFSQTFLFISSLKKYESMILLRFSFRLSVHNSYGEVRSTTIESRLQYLIQFHLPLYFFNVFCFSSCLFYYFVQFYFEDFCMHQRTYEYLNSLKETLIQ